MTSRAHSTIGSTGVEELLPRQLLEDRWVQRLAHISFLGTLDLQPDAVSRWSRLDHSLGVVELASRITAGLAVPFGELREFIAACLLHDVGHLPFSHSAEAAFADKLGGDHHRVAEWVILGEGPIPRSESLRPVLERGALNAERVWSLISGVGVTNNPLAPLLSSPLNVDTLDGIQRTAAQFGRPALPEPAGPPLRLSRGELCLTTAGVSWADRFWALKDAVYNEIVHRPSNLLAEEHLRSWVHLEWIPTPLWPDLLNLVDDALPLGGARSYTMGGMSALDRTYVAVDGPGPHAFQRRHYSVDADVLPDGRGLPATDWRRRYRVAKTVAHLEHRRDGAQASRPDSEQ